MLKKKYAFSSSMSGAAGTASVASSSQGDRHLFEGNKPYGRGEEADEEAVEAEDEDVVSKYFSQRSGGSSQAASQRESTSHPKNDSWLFTSNDDEESAAAAATKKSIPKPKVPLPFARGTSGMGDSEVNLRFENLKKLAGAGGRARRDEAEDDDNDDSYERPAKFSKKRQATISQDEYQDDRSSSYTSDARAQAKRFRPKPDLGQDESEAFEAAEDQGDDEAPRGKVVIRSAVARAPAKEVPVRILKRQREFARLAMLEDETERRRLVEQKKQELRELEQRRLSEKYWMRDFLQGARRSSDDRGPGGKVVLRKEYLQDGAEQHSTGKNLFHNQFLAQPNAVAGRFFVEPMGSKPTELNGEDTLLYIFVEKTGSEGFTLRVDKRYYELFEGDVGIVPPESAYSFVNPSKITSCQFTYILIPVAPPPPPPAGRGSTGTSAGPSRRDQDEEEEQEIDEEELFSYEFRGLKGVGPSKKEGADTADAKS